VRTKVHHLHEMIANGYIKVEHKPTTTMTADLLTKSLSKVKFTTRSSVYECNSKSTPKTSATNSASSQAATEGECWSQSQGSSLQKHSTEFQQCLWLV